MSPSFPSYILQPLAWTLCRINPKSLWLQAQNVERGRKAEMGLDWTGTVPALSEPLSLGCHTAVCQEVSHMLVAQSNELPVASHPLFPCEDLGLGLRKKPFFALSPPSQPLTTCSPHLQPAQKVPAWFTCLVPCSSSSCTWKEQTSLEHFPAPTLPCLSGNMQSSSGMGSTPCCGSGKKLTRSMVGVSLLGIVPIGGKERSHKEAAGFELGPGPWIYFSSTCRGYTGETLSLCPCCPLHPLICVLPNTSNSERRKSLQELLLSSPRRWSEDLPELLMLKAQL